MSNYATARKIISIAPTIVPAAYGDGDVIGTLVTIPFAVRASGAGASIISAALLDKVKQNSDIDIVILSEAPASSFGADNAAYALADTDLAKVLGRISFLTADYVDNTNNSEATKTLIDLIVQAKAKSMDLYAIFVSRGTPTYSSASDLMLRLGLEQN